MPYGNNQMKTIHRYLTSLLLATLVAAYAADVCASVSDEDIIQQLDEKLEELPLSLRQRLWQKMKKHPGRSTIGAATIIVLGVLATGGWLSLRETHEGESTEQSVIPNPINNSWTRIPEPFLTDVPLPNNHWRQRYRDISSDKLWSRLEKKTTSYSKYKKRDWHWKQVGSSGLTNIWRGLSGNDDIFWNKLIQEEEFNDPKILWVGVNIANSLVETKSHYVDRITPEAVAEGVLLFLFGRKAAWDDETEKLLRKTFESFRNKQLMVDKTEGAVEKLYNKDYYAGGIQPELARRHVITDQASGMPGWIRDNLFEDGGSNAVVEFWKEQLSASAKPTAELREED